MRLISITIFAVACNLVSLVIAKPVPNRKTGGGGGMAIPLARHPGPSFTHSNQTTDLDAISSHGISVREKILRGLDNYERNMGTIHPFAVKQLESDSKSGLGRRGASALTSFQNKLWMAEVSIGTPAKTLKVTIDTGAADMWVIETGCAGISGHRDLWDPVSSHSAEYKHQSFWVKYQDGSAVEGGLFTDNVTIGGFTADPQTFGSATSYTSLKKYEYPADGLLGLAFPSVSRFGVAPLFESLFKQNRITKPTFSFKLTSSGGEMYVGGTNSMLYSGDIVYTPVTQPGYWQVSMDDFRVNGNIIFKDVPVMFDTGASHIFGDWERVAELYRRLDGSSLKEYGSFGFYSLPCNSFPTLSFTFGGKTFEVPPEHLRLDPVKRGSSDCFSTLIAQRSSPIASWVIGLTFLQGVYSVFDYGSLQVGFADLA